MKYDKIAACTGVVVLTSLLSVPARAADVTVTVSDGQGLAVADAAVYLLPLQGRAPRGGQKGSIEQIDKTFVPYVSIVQAGTAVSFPNKDNVRHHVYSFSAPKVFDLKLYSGTPSQPVVFDKPGLVALGCNIHDWMLAYVLVVETPWFAVSKERGSVVVENVPAGDYNMTIWHPRMKEEMMQQVKVGASAQTVRARIILSKPDLRRQGG
ncbi:methylamine utilization protein [Vogesella sp. DC21W]|uniref:Methylamine utilization protein n=1 Tax=Vogesella aquatica TaxID=2984206 RepID=A0ABT5J1S3_9NEIS|nr:methylamine utilization protein [Vogesella aquatica]MDC7717799.1 methylamine utilization protein [Vogesella aquatica]